MKSSRGPPAAGLGHADRAFAAGRLPVLGLLANRPFVAAALRGAMQAPQTWLFGAGLAGHAGVPALPDRRALRLGPFDQAAAGAAAGGGGQRQHFMQAYGVVLDPSMIRNVLHTDVAESRELMSWRLVTHLLLYAGLPMLLLWRVRLQTPALFKALAWRLGSLLLALAVLVGALLIGVPALSSLMRNQKELRYLITPGNVLWSLGVVVAANTRGAAKPRQPIGEDAQAGPRLAARSKPLLVVLVVGETARAANWGLNGYARQTTPQLARLPVVNFAEVTSCGTNTEVSLPCMFAPVGRRDYDEDRVRGSQSLLHVLARAGVGVDWRDNQSGCKGVCEGLPSRR
jgi:lipid A ethanolaminephosphotransferase